MVLHLLQEDRRQEQDAQEGPHDQAAGDVGGAEQAFVQQTQIEHGMALAQLPPGEYRQGHDSDDSGDEDLSRVPPFTDPSLIAYKTRASPPPPRTKPRTSSRSF